MKGLYKEHELQGIIKVYRRNMNFKALLSESEDTILREEFDRAICDLSRNQAPEVEAIPSEQLISLREQATTKLF